MRTVYIIFSTVGWAWSALVAAFLLYKTRIAARTDRRRGFEVVGTTSSSRGPNDAK